MIVAGDILEGATVSVGVEKDSLDFIIKQPEYGWKGYIGQIRDIVIKQSLSPGAI